MVKGVSLKDFTDGVSKTFLIGEAGGVPAVSVNPNVMPGIWSGSANENGSQREVVRYAIAKLNEGTVNAFGSYHPRGANFAMADGAVTFIDDSIQASPLGSPALAGVDVTTTNIPTYLSKLSNSGRGVWERLSTRADGLPVGAF